MTREDVIRMALEHFGAVLKPSDLEVKLAVLAVAAEREACAKVCKNEEATLLHKEGLALPQGNPMLLKMASVANFCAIAIRARGEV